MASYRRQNSVRECSILFGKRIWEANLCNPDAITWILRTPNLILMLAFPPTASLANQDINGFLTNLSHLCPPSKDWWTAIYDTVGTVILSRRLKYCPEQELWTISSFNSETQGHTCTLSERLKVYPDQTNEHSGPSPPLPPRGLLPPSGFVGCCFLYRLSCKA